GSPSSRLNSTMQSGMNPAHARASPRRPAATSASTNPPYKTTVTARAIQIQLDNALMPSLHPDAIRPCRRDDRDAILAIVNAAAEAYRGVIPADRWREPYMPADELDEEIAAGVEFWGYEGGGELLGIMGIQPVRDVDLIRHAYVAAHTQRRGVGGALLEHLMRERARQVL